MRSTTWIVFLKKEREIAGEVQKKLFPSNKKIEKYIFAKNTPAKDVSGDYYDYYQVNDNEIYFILGDVTGKGIKAGILMANAAAVFRSLAKMNSSIAKTALYMNNQVKDSSYQAMFITVILGRINLEKKEMEAMLAKNADKEAEARQQKLNREAKTMDDYWRCLHPIDASILLSVIQLPKICKYRTEYF